jgi:hypothetical protein
MIGHYYKICAYTYEVQYYHHHEEGTIHQITVKQFSSSPTHLSLRCMHRECTGCDKQATIILTVFLSLDTVINGHLILTRPILLGKTPANTGTPTFPTKGKAFQSPKNILHLVSWQWGDREICDPNPRPLLFLLTTSLFPKFPINQFQSKTRGIGLNLEVE